MKVGPLTLPSLLHSFSVQGPALCEEWKRGLLGMLVALAPEQAAQVCPPRTFYPPSLDTLITPRPPVRPLSVAARRGRRIARGHQALVE